MRSIPDSQAIGHDRDHVLTDFFCTRTSVPFVFWKIQDTCLHHVPRKSTSLRYHRYAGGLLLQECFPAAGTVRTARADRRALPSFWYTAGRKTRFSPLEEGHCFTCFLFR